MIDDETREIDEVEAPSALKKKRKEKLTKERMAEKAPILFTVVELPPKDEVSKLASNVSNLSMDVSSISCDLEIEILMNVPSQASVDFLWRNLSNGVANQLKKYVHFITSCLGSENMAPKVYNFFPKKYCSHFLSVIYPATPSDEDLVELRKKLVRALFLPADRPLIRKCNRYLLPSERSSPYLMNVHEGLSSDLKEGTVSLVDGDYEYRHYMQDKMNDNGWGCAYRSLQTIITWFRLQGYTQEGVPTHREIQQALVHVGDKEASFVGSSKWIGSQEVS